MGRSGYKKPEIGIFGAPVPKPGVDVSVATTWPITLNLWTYQTLDFDQRKILLSVFQDEAKVTKGACVGLSIEWILCHRAFINSGDLRMQALSQLPLWAKAVRYSGEYNGSLQTDHVKVVSILKTKVDVFYSTASPATDNEICTYFAPNNGYTITVATIKGGPKHMCASYTSTVDGKKSLLFFDPNFGEFEIELELEDVKAFFRAWVDQLSTYKGGRPSNGSSSSEPILELTEFEIFQVSEILPRSPPVPAVAIAV